MESLFYDIKEICTLLKYSRSTVDRMIKRKELPGVVKHGTAVRIHKSTFHKWINLELKN